MTWVRFGAALGRYLLLQERLYGASSLGEAELAAVKLSEARGSLLRAFALDAADVAEPEAIERELVGLVDALAESLAQRAIRELAALKMRGQAEDELHELGHALCGEPTHEITDADVEWMRGCRGGS